MAGVNPEVVFPYQLLFSGPNADAEYLDFLRQLAKIINKHMPNLIRKAGEALESPIQFVCNGAANLWEKLFPTEPTSFFGKIGRFFGKAWSYVSKAIGSVATYLISNPWLRVAIIVLIVLVWMLYRARQSQATQNATYT